MAGWTRVAKMAAAEEQGMQAHCPRCGFTPRAPRTTCPLCARALVTDGPEGTDGRRSAAPLVVLGVGFVLATGGLLVANAIDTDTPPAGMGAGIPRLAPPDSGVLGTTESGGDRKKDPRDGEERTPARDEGEGRGREILLSYAGPSGNGAKEGETKRPDGVGDLADLPPLLPPIGSDEPGGGPPVPPLGDLPGMPPALAPVAEVAAVSSNDDRNSGDGDGDSGSDDGDRSRERGDTGEADAVDLDSFRRDESAYTVALTSGGDRQVSAAEAEGPEAVAETATVLLAVAGIDVPVGVVNDEGRLGLVAYAGRFPFADETGRDEAAADADVLRARIADLLPFDESPLCVVGLEEDPFPCKGSATSSRDDEGGEDAVDLRGGFPDVGSDGAEGGDSGPDPQSEEPSAGEDTDEGPPADDAEPAEDRTPGQE